MAIIGKLIKQAITLKNEFTSTGDIRSEQQSVLTDLLEKAQNTAFGKHYNFHHLLESGNVYQAFQETVPVFDYDKLYEGWWNRVEQGEADITWPGLPQYFAITSGTTGSGNKKIPVTQDMLDSLKTAGLKQVTAMANFDLPASFFEKEIMMLHSSSNLKKGNYLPEGEISGISAYNIPFWFKGYYKPGDEIGAIDDWDERLNRISEKAAEWDIGAISGIPSWVELMLRKVIADHGLTTIHDIWPNLQVYTTGGVAFEPYRKSFQALMSSPITVIDTYLASEGFFAFQSRPQTDAMKLITDHGIFYEFIPFEPDNFDESGNPVNRAPVVDLSQVQPGKEYAMLISTVSGLWRYMIGDTVQFETENEIRITGRTKHFLNVVGSQLSVVRMNEAIGQLEQQSEVTIPEYTVAAVRVNGEYIHRWYLGSESPLEFPNLAETLDNILKASNKNYAVARKKSLKGIEVRMVPLPLFYDWIETRKKKGGQVKFPRVMEESTFLEFENFLTTKLV
jgi:hypothetical protein